MGRIASQFPVGSFKENVVTSTEVSNQEFVESGDDVGPFILGKRGQRGKVIQNDFQLPGGMYTTDRTDGDIHGNYVSFTIEYQQIDDNDVPVGSVVSRGVTVSLCDPTFANGNAGVIATESRLGTTYTRSAARQNSPHRFTITHTMTVSARWSVRVVRSTAGLNAYGNNKFIWSGSKIILDNTTNKVYGDVTLMACRVKASRGIGEDAAIRISALVQRNIKALGSGNNVATNSAADAFVDIYTNKVYGAGRPLTEMDMTKIAQLKTLWGTYQFNHIFDKRISIWAALSRAVAPMVAEPVPLGISMSIAQDGVKPVRSMMFNDANIVRNSMRLSYQWEVIDAPDGVEIEYRDPLRYKPAYAKYPATAVLPERIQLEGCTSKTHADQYAILYWQRRKRQRIAVEFETELEGLLLTMGDRIGVSTVMTNWGTSGLILGIAGNVISLDKPVVWTGAAKYVVLRREDGSCTDPIVVTRAGADHKATLATLPFTPAVNLPQEFTSYTFGELATMTRDFTVFSVRPASNYKVRVEGYIYRPEIFNGTLTYLGGTTTPLDAAAAIQHTGSIDVTEYTVNEPVEPPSMARLP